MRLQSVRMLVPVSIALCFATVAVAQQPRTPAGSKTDDLLAALTQATQAQPQPNATTAPKNSTAPAQATPKVTPSPLPTPVPQAAPKAAPAPSSSASPHTRVIPQVTDPPPVIHGYAEPPMEVRYETVDFGGPAEQWTARFDIEYISLKPRRGASSFAISDPDDLQAGPAFGTVHHVDLDRSTGIRFGSAFRLPGNDWDGRFQYTYLHSNDSRAVNQPAGGTLRPTLVHPNGPAADLPERATLALATARLDYDVMDFEIGRTFQFGGSGESRFGAGARAAWIDQELTARYSGGDFLAPRVVIAPIRFDGQGVRISNETSWEMPYGFEVFGRAAGSLLLGEFRNQLQESRAGAVVVWSREEYKKIIPVAELAIGLSWDRQFGAWNFGVSFGYEMSNWFGLVDQRRFFDDRRVAVSENQNADLGLDGYFLRLSFSR